MTSRRDLLAALVALAATPALARVPAPAQPSAQAADAFADLDRGAVARLGQAWRAANPGVTARKLETRLFPGGRGKASLPRLRDQAMADFRRGAVFTYRGWRLSDTEGALMALLSFEA